MKLSYTSFFICFLGKQKQKLEEAIVEEIHESDNEMDVEEVDSKAV